MRSGRAELEAVTEALKAGPDVIIAGGGWGTRIWPVRPEGNTTGIRILASELDGKRQELLMEMLPDARRIGALAEVNTSGPEHLRTLEDDARSRGVELSAYLVDRQFDTTRARVILQGPQVLWPRGIDLRQRPDATRIGQHLHQKFLPLAVEFGGQDSYPGRVAFRAHWPYARAPPTASDDDVGTGLQGLGDGFKFGPTTTHWVPAMFEVGIT